MKKCLRCNLKKNNKRFKKKYAYIRGIGSGFTHSVVCKECEQLDKITKKLTKNYVHSITQLSKRITKTVALNGRKETRFIHNE